MRNPFMLRATHEEEIDCLRTEVISSERVVHLLDDRLKQFQETLLDIVAKASNKHAVMAAISDFWTLYHERKSDQIIGLMDEIAELTVTEAEKSLDQQLEDIDATIRMTIDSQPIITRDRAIKRRRLDELHKQRTEIVQTIARESAPKADVQVST